MSSASSIGIYMSAQVEFSAAASLKTSWPALSDAISESVFETTLLTFDSL